jgi:hypothetical protein
MINHIPIRLAAPALMVCLLATACGSSTGSTGQGSAQAAGASAFQQCLKRHGVSLPSGRPSFSGTPSPGASFPAGSGQLPGGFGTGTGSKAFQACRKYAPAGFGRGRPGTGSLPPSPPSAAA